MRERGQDYNEALLDGARELGLQIAESQLAAYRTHLQLLFEHNRRAGLTTISDPAEVAIKHFLDSLTCLLARDIAAGERVADVGSGAGFPGLVLAVARPQGSYTLIEATKKRTAFLKLAVEALALTNTTLLAGRAEQAGRNPDHREAYGLVVSRALAPLPVLLEYCLPLANVGGHCLAQKGPEAKEELEGSGRALRILGGSILEVRSLTLPREMGRRNLILVEKTAPTPARYPRRPGMPAKRPL